MAVGRHVSVFTSTPIRGICDDIDRYIGLHRTSLVWFIFMNEIPSSIDTLIVGAGISGLACALECQKNDKQFLLVEETERVGGKVGSMKEDGFIFDLGFQVYNTAYEATNSLLNLEKIDLNHFRPGAMVHDGNSFQMIADPLRDLGQAFGTLFSDNSTIGDNLKVLKLKNSLRGYRIELDNE